MRKAKISAPKKKHKKSKLAPDKSASKQGQSKAQPKIASSQARAKANPKKASAKAKSQIKSSKDQALTAKNNFFVVGIGASAGGLEAFKQLLGNLAPDTGMAYVIVQHLSPRHESMLPSILARETKMPVVEVKNGLMVRPNHVYVIPPNTLMKLAKGGFKLQPRGPSVQPMSIDFFFRSLAEDRPNRCIGVILSGTGSDGSEGLQMIKSEGGITLAQSPESAKFSSMPEQAIALDHLDFVLSPQDIAVELGKISKQTSNFHEIPLGDHKENQNDIFAQILQLLKRKAGTDFSQYKQSTIHRRIARRMLLNKLDSLASYLHFLKNNPAECVAMSQDVLINVTTFFREPEAFDVLRSKIFPDILKNKGEDDSIRIWIPGCSTGEEAYSIAICLVEFLGDDLTQMPVQIFATDLSEKCIEKARAGKYDENIAEHVSAENLKRYFTKIDGSYRISKMIRDLCVFAKHDLTRDPPYSKLDLISCRNVLIYLNQQLQGRLMETFHYSLNKHGYLLLGTSENIGVATDLFSFVDSKSKFYSKKYSVSRPQAATWRADVQAKRSPVDKPEAEARAIAPQIQSEMDRAILTRYSPAAVVINGNFEILQFRGDTDSFLTHKAGEASLSLLRMAREGLAAELREIVQKAKKKKAPVRKEGISINGLYDINLEAIPLKVQPQDQCFLITFEKSTGVERKKISSKSHATTKDKNISSDAKPSKAAFGHLKQELLTTKEHLHSVIQDLEAANQDLQSANEEIVSANEELQSTNEELETSKEELQSTNEELSTVNDELQTRNQELFSLNNDLVNLLNSVYIPIIIVGNNLHIRRFTPTASKIFNVKAGDVGRPITDITSNVINVTELIKMILEVIDSATVQEREIQDHDGHWYQLRIRPYKTQDHKLDGAVVTLLDIDQIKQSRDLAQATLEMIKQPLLVLDANLRVVRANHIFYRTFGLSANTVEHKPIFDLGHEQWNIPEFKKMLAEVLPKEQELKNFPINFNLAGNAGSKMLVSARQIPREANLPKLILLTLETAKDK